MTDRTTSRDVAADVAALLRSRNPLIWICTREEARAEGYLFEAAISAGYNAHTWDVAAGVCNMAGQPERIGGPDPGDTLTAIMERARKETGGERGVWILRDLPPWLTGPGGMTTCRQVRNLARLLPGVPRDAAQALIVLSTEANVPQELSAHAVVLEWPLPDRNEIAAILDGAINALPDEIKAKAATNGTRDAAIDAAVGLSGEEAASCYARSLVQLRRIDPALVAGEKKRIIAKSGVLEWLDPLPGGLDSVGGLDLLKQWLLSRRLAYSPEARAYGLPAPKGALLCGISGTGKTLTARAIATAWQCPLIKLDLGGLRSKFVGESEANLRKALQTIEAIGQCVVLVDEIEKALQGATSGSADGGVSSDALGTLLSWMQDRQSTGFVVATSNDISQLPPELLRKGRFDEIWWVDLPTRIERAEIVTAALRAHGRGEVSVDLGQIADVTAGFTGSEIASTIPSALFSAFADGVREITTNDLLAAAKLIVPLSKTASEKIGKLQQWAEGRARRATTREQTGFSDATARRLDL